MYEGQTFLISTFKTYSGIHDRKFIIQRITIPIQDTEAMYHTIFPENFHLSNHCLHEFIARFDTVSHGLGCAADTVCHVEITEFVNWGIQALVAHWVRVLCLKYEVVIVTSSIDDVILTWWRHRHLRVLWWSNGYVQKGNRACLQTTNQKLYYTHRCKTTAWFQ